MNVHKFNSEVRITQSIDTVLIYIMGVEMAHCTQILKKAPSQHEMSMKTSGLLWKKKAYLIG